jgi:hypothetical protein
MVDARRKCLHTRKYHMVRVKDSTWFLLDDLKKLHKKGSLEKLILFLVDVLTKAKMEAKK